ncbi:hypothetical protein HK105_207493 [Polyrhizophydium stewartii]|uniref:Uncharacterized protein n=1 Tax=Polyrhizophydium stewartii TaxID=2732419 RepID=A0ABR4N0N7_9FUNG
MASPDQPDPATVAAAEPAATEPAAPESVAVQLPDQSDTAAWLAALDSLRAEAAAVRFSESLSRRDGPWVVEAGLRHACVQVQLLAVHVAFLLLKTGVKKLADDMTAAAMLKALLDAAVAADETLRAEALDALLSAASEYRGRVRIEAEGNVVRDAALALTDPRDKLRIAEVFIKLNVYQGYPDEIADVVDVILRNFEHATPHQAPKFVDYLARNGGYFVQYENSSELVARCATLVVAQLATGIPDLVNAACEGLRNSVGGSNQDPWLAALDAAGLFNVVEDRAGMLTEQVATATAGFVGSLLRPVAVAGWWHRVQRTLAVFVECVGSDEPWRAAAGFSAIIVALYTFTYMIRDFSSDRLEFLLDLGLSRRIHAALVNRTWQDANQFISTLDYLMNLAPATKPIRLVVELDDLGAYPHLGSLYDDPASSPETKNKLSKIIFDHFSRHSVSADSSALPHDANSDVKMRFHSNLEEIAPSARTLVEARYVALVSAMLSKPSWWTKVADAEIVAKWSAEARGQGVDEKTVALALEEVRFVAEHGVRTVFDGEATIAHGHVEQTVVSDDVVPDELRKALSRLAGALEDVPEHKKDWHPGTGNQVLDLVHPSLFCLVYGRSRIADVDLRRTLTTMPPWDELASSERVAGVPFFDHAPKFSSRRFQWLPTEFRVQDDGSVSINSPINNLDPMQHRALYATIAKVFSRFVPMFEDLAGIMRINFVRLRIADPMEGYDSSSLWANGRLNMDRPSPVHVPKLPEHFESRNGVPTPTSLRGRDLQVIVKLANIHLTPENPKYAGGSWHIEGTANEAIAATGIFYYDMENITTSKLGFRQHLDTMVTSEQHDVQFWKDVYGIVNDQTKLNEPLGALEAKRGRCVVFPNTHQHLVEPFELADPTRAGFRKILVFFVIDPTRRIVSTAHMAPQQRDWYHAGLASTPLPPELWRNVTRFMPGTMSLDEAKQVRLELMRERTTVQDFVNQYHEDTFNLCEH